MEAVKPHINTRYLEAMEAQITLARYYETKSTFPIRRAQEKIMEKRILDMTASLLMLANPIYVSPDVADALWDSMGDIDHVSLALHPTDAPCQYGFAYIGGEEWPLANQVTGFTSTAKAVSWAVEDDGVWITVYGRSFEHDRPMPGDDKLQMNDLLTYKFGDPLIQAADASADSLSTDDYKRSYIDTDGKMQTISLTREEAYDAILEQQLTALRYLAAIWLFMKQRIAAQGRGGIDRATRRRIPQDYTGSDFVNIVYLRATDRQQRRSRATGTGSKWTHRSIRRAHWHNYWCEGKTPNCDYNQEHIDRRLEPRFVQATVCGPEDAPLKAGTKLFAVVR